MSSFKWSVLLIFLLAAVLSCQKEAGTPECLPQANTTKHHDSVVVMIADDNARLSFNIEVLLVGGSIYNAGVHPTTELSATAWTDHSNLVYLRGLFEFAAMPNGGGNTPPVSAYLSLYSSPQPTHGDQQNANYGSANAFYIRRVTSPWTPTTVTWSSQPTTTTADQVLIPQAATGVQDLINIDVTDMVRQMYIVNNYGFMIQLQNESIYNSRIFCSSTYPDVSKRPKLVVAF